MLELPRHDRPNINYSLEYLYGTTTKVSPNYRMLRNN